MSSSRQHGQLHWPRKKIGIEGTCIGRKKGKMRGDRMLSERGDLETQMQDKQGAKCLGKALDFGRGKTEHPS